MITLIVDERVNGVAVCENWFASLENENRKIIVKAYTAVSYSSVEVNDDINKIKPDLVVCLGSKALSALLPSAAKTPIKELKNFVLDYEDTPVRVTYSSSWAVLNGGVESTAYRTILSDVSQFIADSDNHALPFEYELFQAHQYKEFLSKFSNAGILGYDVEGSSLQPMMSNFQVGGIGLARPDGYAAYLLFKDFGDLDYKLTPDMATVIGRFLKIKNTSARVSVFNLKYEVPLTRANFGVSLSARMGYSYDKLKEFVRGLGTEELGKYPNLAKTVETVESSMVSS